MRVVVVRDRLDASPSTARRIAGLEDARPYKDSVCAELHHECGVGWCSHAASGEIDDRQTAKLLRLLEQLIRCAEVLRLGHQLVVGHIPELAYAVLHRAHVAHCLDDVTGAGFALGANHGGAFADAAEGLAEVAAAAYEGDREVPLIDVVPFVRGGQHFRFVDVVDPHRLEDLGLDEVADAHLRHHRDADSVHNALDHLRVGHAGDTTVGADVSRNTLEGHDGAGASLFGDLRVLRRDDVHDDAALQHLGKATLNGIGSGLDNHRTPPGVDSSIGWARYGYKRESIELRVDFARSYNVAVRTALTRGAPGVGCGWFHEHLEDMTPIRVAVVVALAVATSAMVLSDASEGVGTTVRVSVTASGEQLNGRSLVYPGGMTPDGRYVAFSTEASNLYPGDYDSISEVAVKDTLTGAVDLVSVSSGGVPGTGQFADISADGRFVAFWSSSSNLVPGDTNGDGDAFLRDRQADTTILVGLSPTGGQSTNGSEAPSVSDDGRFVAFSAVAQWGFPGEIERHIYVRDTLNNTTELISQSNLGVPAYCPTTIDCSNAPAISGNGRYVTFGSKSANLVPSDTNDVSDIFVYDRDTDSIERISLGAAGVQANAGSTDASVSADGRVVEFVSAASTLVAGDTNERFDAFVRDRQTQVTTRVSVSSGGFEANNDTLDAIISDNGRYVALSSLASNLVQGDTNGAQDGFVHDLQTGTTNRVTVDPSGQQLAGLSGGVNISEDGRSAAFYSEACDVTAGDTNSTDDVFLRDLQATTGPPVTCGFLEVATDLEDDSTPPNLPNSAGSVDWCRRVNPNGLLDGDEDAIDRITVDIVVAPHAIPGSSPLHAFDFALSYNPDVVRIVAADDRQILAASPGDPDPTSLSDATPDQDGSWFGGAIDLGGQAESGTGVLLRLTLEAAAPGITPIVVDPASLLGQNATPIPVNAVWPGTLVSGPDSGLCTSDHARPAPALEEGDRVRSR